MKATDVELVFSRLKKQLPEPTTELVYSSPFELLVAVILSAQATDVSVNLATEKLYPVANTPQAIYDLGVKRLKTFVRTIGLFNTKAENIIKTCRILLDEHHGQVPEDRAALEALPGVGRKTANVILNTAFGHPTIAVDTHIFRVSNRLDLAPGKNVVEVENGLLATVPEKYLLDAHHWLILHGRYTCIARKPLCDQCVLADLCPSAFQVEPVARKKKAGKKKTSKKKVVARKKSRRRAAAKSAKSRSPGNPGHG